MEYVTIQVTYPAGYFFNPDFRISGSLPTEEFANGSALEHGWEYQIEKVMETVPTGTNTLTVTITATEQASQGEHPEGYSESVTVTITGVQGEGYPIEDE